MTMKIRFSDTTYNELQLILIASIIPVQLYLELRLADKPGAYVD